MKTKTDQIEKSVKALVIFFMIALVLSGITAFPVETELSMIACLMIFPLALIAGEIRSIPAGWRLIDCAFGALRLIPLAICEHRIKQLEQLKTITS